MQYCFEGNSIKMLSLSSKEDFLIGGRENITKEQFIKEVKRNKKLRDKLI